MPNVAYWQKPCVFYREVRYLRKGEACVILPVNHPSPHVSNAPKWAVTSLVLNINHETGEIETENTVYLKEEDEDVGQRKD